MTENIIRMKIEHGDYENKTPRPSREAFPENHVFDEEKSVRWNREEVERRNRDRVAEIKAYHNMVTQYERLFHKDIVQYLLDNYHINDNQMIAEKIFEMAKETSDNGHLNIFFGASEIADFVEKILTM